MSFSIEKLNGTAYLSFPEMKDLLISEFDTRFGINLKGREDFGDLIYTETECENITPVTETIADGNEKIIRYEAEGIPYWCRCAMLDPVKIHFGSIGDAAQALKQFQRSWAPYQYTLFRRASLVQEKLPYVNLKNRDFPFSIPHSAIGLYTMTDEHTMIASPKTNSCLPAGTIIWNEDHTNPPSRAYLKIQESLVLANHFFGTPLPQKGSRCFEAGACPGGWTWVLANLGSEIFAVDRAELAPSLMKNPLVTFRAHDAFTLKPAELGPFDWVFSDVICYPERLLEWIQTWLSSGLTKNMICTIKMQGAIDWNLVSKFEEIPRSKVVHLNYNKHELTFIHCEP